MAQIIKKDRVRVGEPVAAPPRTAEATPRRAAAKSVELVRVDGRVHAIQVTCACGEVTVLELAYEPEADPSAGGTA